MMDTLPFGDVDLLDFVVSKGTPCYIHDGPTIAAWNRHLRASLTTHLALSRMVGATPNPHLLRWMQPHLDGLSVASGVELRLAISAGMHPQRLDFLAPGKRDAELELAIGSGLGSISLESATELERIDHIGRRLGRKAVLALRIHLRSPTHDSGDNSGPTRPEYHPCPGFDLDQGAALIKALGSRSGCRYGGLYFNFNTSSLRADPDSRTINPNTEPMLDGFRQALATIAELAQMTEQWPERVIFAKCPVLPSHAEKHIQDKVALTRDLATLWATFKAEHKPPAVSGILEMDPSLGPMTTLHVARVVATRQAGTMTCCILDDEIPPHLPAGCAINLSNPDGTPPVPVLLTGLRTSDLLEQNNGIFMPMPQVGDYIGIYQDGGYTAKSSHFFSHLTCAEYLIDGPEHVRTIRHVLDPSRLGVPP
ncbi:MAG: hypothetical protein HQL65_03135 [Magnetococcales bacterium]|nr:hypothetical protein [Magnetococcales bacterium]